jgi:hypothetical protein
MADTRLPQDSAGQIAISDQQARVQGATVSNPSPEITAPPNSIDTTLLSQPLSRDQQAYFNQINGRITPDTTLPLSVTQATPPNNINDLANSPIATPSAQTGAGAPGEDSGTVTGNTTKDIINLTYNYNQQITARPNVLDDYASYTYQIGWYLLSEQQYNTLINSTQRSVGSWSLLMQSGGIPLQSTTSVANTNTAIGSNPNLPNAPSRNQAFPYDYYLDDLEIHSLIPLGGTGLAHSAASIKFKVVEPNGLTLIDNIYAAVKALYGDTNSVDYQPATNIYYSPGQAPQSIPAASLDTPNFITAHYCLVIRFYGYDNQGNLQAPIKNKNNTTVTNPPGLPADAKAVVQKIYPFLISDITFAMMPGANSRGVEYHVSGIPTGMQLAFGQARGTIPFNFELSGTTVQELIVGKNAAASLPAQQEGRITQADPPQSPPAPPASDTPGDNPNIGLPAAYDINGLPTYAYGA